MTQDYWPFELKVCQFYLVLRSSSRFLNKFVDPFFGLRKFTTGPEDFSFALKFTISGLISDSWAQVADRIRDKSWSPNVQGGPISECLTERQFLKIRQLFLFRLLIFFSFLNALFHVLGFWNDLETSNFQDTKKVSFPVNRQLKLKDAFPFWS